MKKALPLELTVLEGFEERTGITMKTVRVERVLRVANYTLLLALAAFSLYFMMRIAVTSFLSSPNNALNESQDDRRASEIEKMADVIVDSEFGSTDGNIKPTGSYTEPVNGYNVHKDGSIEPIDNNTEQVGGGIKPFDDNTEPTDGYIIPLDSNTESVDGNVNDNDNISVIPFDFDFASTENLHIEFIDGHADTITKAMEKEQNLYRNKLHLDFERLREFTTPVQVFAIWCDDKHVGNAYEYANLAIDFFEKELSNHKDIIEIALSLDDIERNAKNGKISAILSLEGAEPLEGKIENLDHFYNRGVRLVTITWNRENELAYGVGVRGSDSDRGLKPFGIECVKRMNELGIIIDVSHLNEAGFWDVDQLSARPYIASHSNAYSVTPNKRNLKDDQIAAIVEKGGIIGINLYPIFLAADGNADFSSVMDHVNYLIRLSAGGNIGLGCDLDGIESPPNGFTDVSSLRALAKYMTDSIGESTMRSIMSENYIKFFIRFFRDESPQSLRAISTKDWLQRFGKGLLWRRP